ncbi:IclR family transcriptional regulator [Streptomyces sp. NPDC004542]|uniref:IclR family transcriptional regulator n=1 Tax=Streptomyces sp. NPDC004542 TaxID=3154281 RepID=UPI00339F9B18
MLMEAGASNTAGLLDFPDEHRAADAKTRRVPLSESRNGSETSVGKALTLLDAFGGPRTVLGVSELAVRAGLPKSTAFRLLSVLLESGYVRRVGDRYSLTEHIFELGQRVSSCRPNGLRERALPFMTELYAETRETVHLGVLRGTEVLYLEKIFGHHAAPCTTSVGTRRPAYCTALGKAILAFSDSVAQEAILESPMSRHTPYTLSQPGQLSISLQRVRENGFATDLQESHLGVVCLAAPLIDRATGRAVAALSISSTTARGDIRRYAARLSRSSETLSSLIQPSMAS